MYQQINRAALKADARAAMRESKCSTKHRAAPVCPSSANFSAGVLSRAGR